jgi:pimeloyl-ACP methyl ester carboxylesterase
MAIEKHVITYPGFAESANARGLYDELEEVYSPPYTFHILPFYEESSETGERIVYSIEKHRDVLQDYMDNLGGEITILGKCGGSRVVSSLDDEHLSRVGKMALFNPPWAISKESLEGRFRGWKGEPREDGSWTIPRRGNPPYVVKPEYLEDVGTMSLMENYRRVARLTNLFIVRGLDDQVIRPIRVEEIEGATPIDIPGGDHHLSDPARQIVISALAKYAVL